LINFQPFQGEEHRPFYWTGGQPAALLIHGFPGTPAELRPLGQALHQAGWTVHGPLLPGFGPDLESLPRREASEWIEAIEQAVANLQSRHNPMILIGYSMGAALAVQAAASTATVAKPPNELAKEITVPALIVQGTQDEIVDPPGTRKLLQRRPGLIQYAELVGGHDLLDRDRPTWRQVEQIVLNFANSFTDESAQRANEIEISKDRQAPDSRSAE
jgi:esterase/lipase